MKIIEFLESLIKYIEKIDNLEKRVADLEKNKGGSNEKNDFAKNNKPL